MSRYHTLHTLKKESKTGYLPYVMLGYPNQKGCLEVSKTLLENGAAGLELGLPFSDPVADGPVIEAAGQEALKNGFKIEDALELITSIRSLAGDRPLTLMAYYNMVQVHGVDDFIQKFAKAGIDGLLVPDISVEAINELAPACKIHNIACIMLASPLTDEARLAKIAPYAEGFLYVVTRLGVTGTFENYSTELEGLFNRIQKYIDLPTYAGFGVSTPEQAQHMIQAGADGVITGSQIVKLTKDVKALTQHTQQMCGALL